MSYLSQAYYTVKQMLIPIFRLKLHTWSRIQASELILRCTNNIYGINALSNSGRQAFLLMS